MELSEEVTLLKSRDMNLCHTIAQVVSEHLGALYGNVLLGFTARRCNACGEASKAHTSSGWLVGGVSPRAGQRSLPKGGNFLAH